MQAFDQELDLTRSATAARDFVRGKSLDESLLALYLCFEPPEVETLRREVDEIQDEVPLPSLFSKVIVDAQGRVVERVPGRLAGDDASVNAAIEAEMYSHARYHQMVAALGVINPIARQITLEHYLTPVSLLEITLDNPFVPSGREFLFAEGLYYGFHERYDLACHLLIPQLESSIRHVMSERGVVTSNLDSSARQPVQDLNTLLRRQEAVDIFGEDLVFDLRGLLVERFGSNLRNRFAHGLMDHGEFFQPRAIYLWWLALRLCFPPKLDQFVQRVEHVKTESNPEVG